MELHWKCSCCIGRIRVMAGYDLELNNKNTQDFNVVFHGPKESETSDAADRSSLRSLAFPLRHFPLARQLANRIGIFSSFACLVLASLRWCFSECDSHIRRWGVAGARNSSRRLPLFVPFNWFFEQNFTSERRRSLWVGLPRRHQSDLDAFIQ